MTIGPILTGRLPNNFLTRQLQQNLQSANSLLSTLQNQVATGQRFFSPSEDVTEAIRVISLQTTLERKAQIQSNIKTDRTLLSISENALASLGDALNQAQSLVLAGTGNSLSGTEKESLANDVASLIQQVVNVGNTASQGRYLFAGSQSKTVPFEFSSNGTVVFNGDDHQIQSFIDTNLLLPNNIDGLSAFAAQTPPVGSDINPALSLQTKIADLHGGEGIDLESISVSVDDTVTLTTEVIDLSAAKTIADIKTILEDRFGGDLTVRVDPTQAAGIIIEGPAGGTVAIGNAAGSVTASQLGVVSTAAATINGNDLDPQLTLQTQIADLNGGNGITATAAGGLLINNGHKSAVVDVSAAVTIEDLFNTLEAANLDLAVGINAAGDGLAISSRISGANFSIGENGETTAADLGIRTLTGETRLSDLNLNVGVPLESDADDPNAEVHLEIQLRDGQVVEIDLSAAHTVQDVLDAISADAGLTATFNAIGNGITITDDTGGLGILSVSESELSRALGINLESSTPGESLVGSDVNPQEATGLINILLRLETALRSGDNAELSRLDSLLEAETSRVNLVRGELGNRLSVLDEVESRLLDQEISMQESLSRAFDADLAEAVTQTAAVQSALQATLQMAASTLQLNLINFL